jgi:hypothetical protein
MFFGRFSNSRNLLCDREQETSCSVGVWDRGGAMGFASLVFQLAVLRGLFARGPSENERLLLYVGRISHTPSVGVVDHW